VSLIATKAVWAMDVKPVSKLVLLKLAEHADEAGLCYPSLTTICEGTGLSRAAVCQHLSELAAGGFIIRVTGGPAGRTSTRYHIKWSAPQTSPPDKLVRVVDSSSPPDGLQVVREMDPNHHVTVKNHQIRRKTAGNACQAIADSLWQAAHQKSRERSSKKQIFTALKAIPPRDLPLLETLVASLACWNRSEDWSKEAGRFIPGLHRWISNRKWEVEPSIAKPATSRPLLSL